jgi:teichuronic acid biosynthesis glycosyltransferase TuaC
VHILIIPTGVYPLPQVPLGCIFEQHQAEALLSAGQKVGVVSGGVITTRYLGRPFPYRVHDRVNGIPVYRAHRRAHLPARWEPRLAAAERTYIHLRPLMEEYIRDRGRPDIVHAHNLSSGGLIARRVLEDFGIPYVVTEHTSTYAAESSVVERDLPVISPAADHASAVIAVGGELAGNLRLGLGGEVAGRVVVVPNVVDRVLLSTPLEERRGPYTVAGLGYLIPRKNYALLLQAFARARLPGDARLVIGGHGPEHGRLRRLANGLRLSDRVDFRGDLRRGDVLTLLQGADLFAHPSDGESFGVVLIEAMALGVPLLATESGGPQDIVTPDVGLLTPVGDVDAFATGLSEMYRRRSEFNPEQIREACRERFGPEAFASRMLEFYRRAAS